MNVKKDALYSPCFLSTADQAQDSYIEINLLEPGAEVDLKGLLIAKGNQKIYNTVIINHLAEYTNSNQYLKTMAADNAEIIANATITIGSAAAHSSASQLAKNLLLSPSAHIHTEPKLKINNDDIKASHGSSVGALDPESIFYLKSRGIEAEDAKNILTQAFVNEILDTIDSKEALAAINYD